MSTAPAWVDRAAWPWPIREQPVPGGTLRYVDEGEGPTVLFVHGTPSWGFDWRHAIAALRGTHRCVAVDHLGFGCSDRPAGADYSPEAHAERLAAFVAALDLRDYALVVHDFGGPIGLPLALAGERRPAKLVITNTFAWSFADDAAMWWPARLLATPLGRWAYRWVNLSLRVITPSAYADRRRLTPAIHGQLLAPFVDRDDRVRVLWALARSLTASSAHFASLWERRAALAELPALVVWGLGDSAFPPRYLDRWRSALPRAQVVALADAGHWPLEESPDAVIAALRAFL
jgi:haloalkane dehalogenase